MRLSMSNYDPLLIAELLKKQKEKAIYELSKTRSKRVRKGLKNIGIWVSNAEYLMYLKHIERIGSLSMSDFIRTALKEYCTSHE